MDPQPVAISRSIKPMPVKAQVISLFAQGNSKQQIARTLQIADGTVDRILSEANMSTSAEIPVSQILDRVGATRELIANKLLTLTTAEETKLASFEGKFTDERQVPDSNVRFRAAEALGKMHGMFPREDASVTAQLFVRLPDIELRPGHGKACACPECCDAWSQAPTPVLSPDDSK